jgi:hypothetical protein
MTPSLDRTCRVTRRAEPHRFLGTLLRILGALPLVLVPWGCDQPSSVEHQPDPMEVGDGEAAAPVTYVFDPASVRTVHGHVLAVQPFQRMQGTRYGVRLRLEVDRERVYVYLAPQGFLADRELVFAVADEVDVTGSLLGEPGQRVMIATEIAKDGKAFELRDAGGDPLWQR